MIFMILDLLYVKQPQITGELNKDAINLLYENGKEKIAIHSTKVAKTCTELAKRFKCNEEIAYISGILHDISAVIRPIDMMQYAQSNDWYIDESEKKHNFILHQRISAIIAKKEFNVTDSHILSAIECHSTLKANASEYDILLFLSDKISWDQAETPPFLEILLNAIDISLEYAALTYIRFVIENNMILLPHMWLKEAKEWLEQRCTQ